MCNFLLNLKGKKNYEVPLTRKGSSIYCTQKREIVHTLKYRNVLSTKYFIFTTEFVARCLYSSL